MTKLRIIQKIFANIFAYYSHSSAPFFHSYTNPIVKMNKNTTIDQNANNGKFTKESQIAERIFTKAVAWPLFAMGGIGAVVFISRDN